MEAAAVFYNYSYVLGDDQQYSQQMQFNPPILHRVLLNRAPSSTQLHPAPSSSF